MTFFRLLIASILIVQLTGCANVPLEKFSDSLFQPSLRERLRAKDTRNEIRFSRKKGEVCASTGQELRLSPKPFRVTSNCLEKVEFEIDGPITDLSAALKPYGFSVIVSPNLEDLKLKISYKGQLKDFLESLSRTHGIIVDEYKKIITLKKETTYTLNLPPYVKEISSYIQDKLVTLYGSDANYDMITQSVTFKGDANDGITFLNTFEDLLENTSLVELEFVIFEGRFGDLMDIGGSAGYKNITDSSIVKLTAGQASLTGVRDFGLVINSDHFLSTLTALVRQHKARILQKPRLAVLSGTTGKLLIGTEQRYLKNGSQTITDKGLVVTDLDLGEVLDGVDLKVRPAFDPSSHLVYLDIDLLVSEILGFQELKVGRKFTSNQPIVDKKQMTLEVPVKAGRVFVFGGISLDQKKDNRGLLSIGNSSGKRELIFGIRPRVVKYSCGDPLKRYLKEHRLTMDDIQKLDASEQIIKKVLKKSEEISSPEVNSEAIKQDLEEILKKLNEAKKIEKKPTAPEPVFLNKVKAAPDPTKPKLEKKKIKKVEKLEKTEKAIKTLSNDLSKLPDSEYIIKAQLSNGKILFVKPSEREKTYKKLGQEGVGIFDEEAIRFKDVESSSKLDKKEKGKEKADKKEKKEVSKDLKKTSEVKIDLKNVKLKKINPIGIPDKTAELKPPVSN